MTFLKGCTNRSRWEANRAFHTCSTKKVQKPNMPNPVQFDFIAYASLIPSCTVNPISSLRIHFLLFPFIHRRWCCCVMCLMQAFPPWRPWASFSLCSPQLLLHYSCCRSAGSTCRAAASLTANRLPDRVHQVSSLQAKQKATNLLWGWQTDWFISCSEKKEIWVQPLLSTRLRGLQVVPCRLVSSLGKPCLSHLLQLWLLSPPTGCDRDGWALKLGAWFWPQHPLPSGQLLSRGTSFGNRRKQDAGRPPSSALREPRGGCWLPLPGLPGLAPG